MRYAIFHPLARFLVAMIFLMSGFSKITGLDANVAYAASAGLPMPEVAIVIAAIVELAGGALLLLGWHTRWAAAALFIYMIPATVAFHLMPALTDPAQQQMQIIQVLKNLAIMGGLLKFWLEGAGAYALDRARVGIPGRPVEQH
ncbi:MAG: DoxX family protein [Acidobacteria bacterium]|nr:DoxX family protein [Acidobacteriota bacterium]MBI3280873.1 DoxX family protein [Acidobacteriota bacterium]